jgi:hypothetical protein
MLIRYQSFEKVLDPPLMLIRQISLVPCRLEPGGLCELVNPPSKRSRKPQLLRLIGVECARNQVDQNARR